MITIASPFVRNASSIGALVGVVFTFQFWAIQFITIVATVFTKRIEKGTANKENERDKEAEMSF